MTENNVSRFLRLTHLFDDCAYAMWVGEPNEARTARRPRRLTLSELDLLMKNRKATWGQLRLPPDLLNVPDKDSLGWRTLEHLWDQIKPLIVEFRDPYNLSRLRFSSLIAQHAELIQGSATTLKRLVLRYYYFGGTKNALLPLAPGTRPNQRQKNKETPQHRRGRQSVSSRKYGANDFVVSASDIEDMCCVHSKLCLHGSSTVSYAYDRYLADEFRRRHPEEYAAYINEQRSEPVTLRQFRHYTKEARAPDDETQSKRAAARRDSSGTLQAASPGDITEVDATGGRIFLVEQGKPEGPACKCIIYIAIDRWSRFITGLYVSLKPASYDELRYLLLVCMTPREARFRAMNVNVTDKVWPYGRVSAVMTFDRGSDFLAESTKQAAADDLRIELAYLPPLCPDGKAIVERVIGVLKRRFASRRLKGSYKDRPLDPKTKRVARRARSAAAYTLAEVYRILVDEVVQHNSRPHPALRRRKVLAQATVPPTPMQAYLWGLQNLGGVHSPPLTDADYQRLLLASGTGYIKNGGCQFLRRSYIPVNSEALVIAARSTKRSKETSVRYDRTFPHFIYIPTTGPEWAKFEMTPESAEELRGMSLDEEEALSGTSSYLWAEADTTARRERVQNVSAASSRSTAKRKSASQIQSQASGMRERETADIKQRLTKNNSGRLPDERTDSHCSAGVDWQSAYREEQRKTVAAIRKQRKAK
ncbi:DDE-type integrase/transposase/recombinase [Paraburkholderia panacisoli]|uniref:DDE-type integrase/transposase/recombinase n=1 Tax=Paraburkholderia panacisoli TaxID=2603818 RepID=UPI00165F02A5|nr:DDE-type integrase/transposase/recombinase [Paraburkholderia panacisoli]